VGAAEAAWPDLNQSILSGYQLTVAEVEGISVGYDDGLWRPWRFITRGEFAKMAVSAFDVSLTPLPSTPTFNDVAPGSTFFAYVEAGYREGFIKGSIDPDVPGELIFRPHDVISRQEAVAFLARHLALTKGYGEVGDLYTDAEIDAILGPFVDDGAVSADLRAEMAFAVQHEVVQGSLGPGGQLRLAPQRLLMRIEGAALIIRSLEVPEALNVVLNPGTATNLVGGTHTVTANVAGGAPAGATYRFRVTGANPEPLSTQSSASFSYVGTDPGTDTISVEVLDGGIEVGSDEATKVWAAPTAVTLTPGTATNVTGSTHTVTAQLSLPAGVSLPSTVRYRFGVAGENPVPQTLQTSSAFSYVGTDPGTDTISVQIFNNGLSLGAATATKTWLAAAGVSLTPGSATNVIGSTHTVTANVTGGVPAGADYRFSVTGDNPRAVSTQDENAFSYKGLQPGTDTIRVEVVTEGVTIGAATATKTWVDATGITLSPGEAANLVGNTHTVTAAVGLPQGVDLPDTMIYRFSVLDENPIAPVNQAGSSFTYRGTRIGEDTIRVEAFNNGVSLGVGTAAKTWVGADVALTPETDTPIVGMSLETTATLSGVPSLVGTSLQYEFRVTGANPVGPEMTAANVFAYTGDSAGEDTITVNVYNWDILAGFTSIPVTWIELN